MEIGVVVYSHTGHTAKLAERLVPRLEALGWGVTVLPLAPAAEFSMNVERTPLASLPEIAPFDVVVVGTPVHGGRMSAPVRTFLGQSPLLAGKPVAFLLTHFFPRQWGAVQTIDEMAVLCDDAGATVLDSADVAWLGLGRRRRMDRAAADLAEKLRKREIKVNFA
jgi:menaquinone-dependent protoporphyrinogen IX oxidase